VAELVEDHPGCGCEHPVATGHGLGELGERGGVHHASPGSTGRRQRHRNAASRCDRTDRGVDDPVERRGVGQCSVVQTAEAAAADAAALTGSQR
jgi:hypothetical protein